jgi:hypothetical protein
MIDELIVTWPDKKQQVLKNIQADQTLKLKYADAVDFKEKPAQEPSFIDVTKQAGITFVHHEDKYDDFEFEPLLPYKNSQLGPGLTVGDINADGLEDFFVGNGKGFKGAMYTQTHNGKFQEIPGPWINDSLYEDTGALLFDADNDGRMDLYVVSGGNDSREKDEYYTDRLYLNTQNGFVKCKNCLPAEIKISGKCVKVADFDKDGHPDLFVGGRIVPGKYPLPANSCILKNNGKQGAELKFENITENIAPELLKPGLVTDAVWDDFDGDGYVDLIVVGEWMKIHFFKNSSDRFIDVSDKLGFNETVGWWNSINCIDIDKDGDNDYLVGNLGLNYKYKTRGKELFEIYSNDFDVNGNLDIALGYGENGKIYPVNSFDDNLRQLPVLKLRYKGYEEFARATLPEIFGDQMLKSSLHYIVNTFASCWIENKGKGEYKMHELPNRAQFSSINDMAEVKYKDYSTAFIVAGNLYGSEVETPRNDASVGLLLISDSKGELKALPPSESSLMIKGEVKVIRKIKMASGTEAYLFAINGDSLKLVESINK